MMSLVEQPGRPRDSQTLRRAAQFLVFLVALVAPVVQAQEKPSLIETVRSSGFIFLGTVKALGAATPTILLQPNSAVVSVDRILEALPPVGNHTGHDVTVRLRDLSKNKVGQQMIFFTYVHSMGQTLGLVEVASEPAGQANAFQRRILEARQAIADQALGRRLETAAIVVVGTFGQGKPTTEASEFRGEHDPLWWRAPIRVESYAKGGTGKKTVDVNFANSFSPMWRDAPKPNAGETGIYLLQPGQGEPFYVDGFFLVDPLDALPKSELERVRKLLSKQDEPPVVR